MSEYLYDDHVYKLTSATPSHTVDLPKDLEWVDEANWSPVGQNVEYSTTGAFLIQEGLKQKGRTITLVGKDDMAWIDRTIYDKLITMRNLPGLIFTFEFVKRTWNESLMQYVYSDPRFQFNAQFNHVDGALELESAKRWDNFESHSWFKIRYIRLFEVSL